MKISTFIVYLNTYGMYKCNKPFCVHVCTFHNLEHLLCSQMLFPPVRVYTHLGQHYKEMASASNKSFLSMFRMVGHLLS